MDNLLPQKKHFLKKRLIKSMFFHTCHVHICFYKTLRIWTFSVLTKIILFFRFIWVTRWDDGKNKAGFFKWKKKKSTQKRATAKNSIFKSPGFFFPNHLELKPWFHASLNKIDNINTKLLLEICLFSSPACNHSSDFISWKASSSSSHNCILRKCLISPVLITLSDYFSIYIIPC